jgi:hypothetical protein
MFFSGVSSCGIGQGAPTRVPSLGFPLRASVRRENSKHLIFVLA